MPRPKTVEVEATWHRFYVRLFMGGAEVTRVLDGGVAWVPSWLLTGTCQSDLAASAADVLDVPIAGTTRNLLVHGLVEK